MSEWRQQEPKFYVAHNKAENINPETPETTETPETPESFLKDDGRRSCPESVSTFNIFVVFCLQ